MNKIEFVRLYLIRLITRYWKRIFKGHLRNNGSPIHFKQQVGKVFSAQSSIKKFSILIIIFIVGFIIWQFRDNIRPKPVISEGIIGFYTEETLPSTVSSLLSKPLIIFDQSGHPIPNLISSWQATDEAKLYQLNLKPNLVWNDNTPIISSDIHFKLADVDVSYPDDKTIIFKLADSFSPFPTLLSYPVVKKGSLIGTGNYNVVQVEKNKNVITKLFLTPVEKTSNLPSIIIRFYQDEKTAKTAFAMGEVNSLLGINDMSDLLNQPASLISGYQTRNKLVAIYYNTKDPILSDKNIRKALNCAIPPIQGEVKIKSPIPANSWAFNDTTKDCFDNPEQSKIYLSKFQGNKDSPIILTSTPYLAQTAEKVINAWKEIGLNTALRIESGSPQIFQALLTMQTIPNDPDQYSLWHSTQSQTNLSKLKSDRIDKDLEDGRKSTDPKIRLDRYFDFQKLLIDDPPASFLYFAKINIIYRQNVADELEKVIKLQITAN